MTIKGNIYDEYAKDVGTLSNVPVSGATVTLNNHYTITANSDGFYSKYGYFPRYANVPVKVTKWGFYDYTGYEYTGAKSSINYKDVYIDDKGDRYAYFFYQPTEDGGFFGQNAVDEYTNTLEARGYTVYNRPDPNNWKSDMADLDDMESTYDRIFIYISGHGSYHNPIIGDDYSKVNVADGVFESDIRSNVLRKKINDLESERITVLVQSCSSGDFKDELDNEGNDACDYVNVMTSADQSHSSYYNGQTGADAESLFSNYFFNAISYGYTITEAFNYAKNYNSYTSSPNPLCDFNARSYEYL
jgi:hypothetical protein